MFLQCILFQVPPKQKYVTPLFSVPFPLQVSVGSFSLLWHMNSLSFEGCNFKAKPQPLIKSSDSSTVITSSL